MKLLFLIVGIVCVTPILSQRFNGRPAQQSCITPENYYGTCVALSYCPQVVNVFQNRNQQVAQQYLFALQRSCGTRNINGDPVVCCTRPLTAPVTQAPSNPFLPSEPRPTQVPTGGTIRPVPPTARPTAPPTARPTAPPTARPVTSAPLIDNRGTYCRGPDTREGVCILLVNCEELSNQLLERYQDETFTKYLRASNAICGGQGSSVCCPTKGNGGATTNKPIRIQNSNEIPRRLPTVQEGCGYSAATFKKIVGGEDAKKGAWPWIVLLGYDDGISASPFKCGGTLVTARHVITAAHCIRGDLTFVRLGEHDLTRNDEAQHQDIRVVKTEVHPQYNKRNGRSDIAVLYLESNAKFTDSVAPACLPTTPELRRKSYVELKPFVVGWGKTMEGGVSANILQQLQIFVYSNQVCQSSYAARNRFLSADQFDAAVICAGDLSGGKDTCQGDSGGPLLSPELYQNNYYYYLIGVVSYGIGCAQPDVPGVYTSTQYFMDWITEKIANTP